MENTKIFKNGAWEGEGNYPEEMSDAENEMYEARAAVLATEHKTPKVHIVVQMDPETFERSVCYLTEPSYAVQLSVLSKLKEIGTYIAIDELREACVIKEASDPITYGESPVSNRYKLGITQYLIPQIRLLNNQYKKK